jgi:hypothetical protein
MSTPWSSDQVPGGDADPFGSGNTNPPPDETWPDPTEVDPELPEPEPLDPEPLEPELLDRAAAAWAA